ncbi:uncharacterized protein LOC124647538 [Lolium rigidum]|uniref:uncharacterized protein LOC124647538 n=1 Tax=Lolium rigidum TaxID=89674 RepID=UPI001F5E01DE|nr:uncharacterized protein LOC124647538 [Lolium rigidum]
MASIEVALVAVAVVAVASNQHERGGVLDYECRGGPCSLIFRSWKAAWLCPKGIRGNPAPLLPSLRLDQGLDQIFSMACNAVQQDSEGGWGFEADCWFRYGLSLLVQGSFEFCPYHLVQW